MSKEDLRIRRTKKQLYDSLLKLLETTEFNNIKVIDVCKLSNINRSTFYDHFKKKDDLLLYISDQLKEELIKSLNIDYKFQNKKELLIKIVSEFNIFIDKNRTIINCLSTNHIALLLQKYFESLEEIMQKYLSKEDAIFYSGGLSSLLLKQQIDNNKITTIIDKLF